MQHLEPVQPPVRHLSPAQGGRVAGAEPRLSEQHHRRSQAPAEHVRIRRALQSRWKVPQRPQPLAPMGVAATPPERFHGPPDGRAGLAGCAIPPHGRQARSAGRPAEPRQRVPRQFLKVPAHLGGERGFDRVRVGAEPRSERRRDARRPVCPSVAHAAGEFEDGALNLRPLDQVAPQPRSLNLSAVSQRAHPPGAS
jgi:hypothetical protein